MVELQRPVATAMSAYVRALFRVRTFGLEQLRLEPGTLIAPNHRSDNDVPVLVSQLYRSWAAAVGRGVPWPTFAADDHVFLRGFLAGYPEPLPLWLRRALWPIRVGGVLDRRLQCVPVREPARMRLVELLRAAPALPLDGQLPDELRAAILRRAAERGWDVPQRTGDVLKGGYADLLWTLIDRDAVAGCEEIWRAHLRAAVGDFRRLVSALRSGGLVVIYPEGELSPDGLIGPLKPGLASLARRGRARLVQPVAIAYDPLTFGRPRAYVSIAPAIEPGRRGLGDEVSKALRHATPLTVGQVVAWSLKRYGRSRRALAAAAAALVERAIGDGRPIEPALCGPRRQVVLQCAYARGLRRGIDGPLIERLANELQNIQSP